MGQNAETRAETGVSKMNIRNYIFGFLFFISVFLIAIKDVNDPSDVKHPYEAEMPELLDRHINRHKYEYNIKPYMFENPYENKRTAAQSRNNLTKEKKKVPKLTVKDIPSPSKKFSSVKDMPKLKK